VNKPNRKCAEPKPIRSHWTLSGERGSAGVEQTECLHFYFIEIHWGIRTVMKATRTLWIIFVLQRRQLLFKP